MIDPDGRCGTDEDGNPVGVCPTDIGAVPLVTNALADDHSNISTLDAEAQAAGILIDVSTGDTAFSGDEVHGGKAEPLYDKAGNLKVVAVTVDLSDTVRTEGINTKTNEEVTFVLSPADILEHEGAGHALDFIRGIDRGPVKDESHARDVGNLRREKSKNPLKRTSPIITID